MDYEKEAEKRFQAADEALDELLRTAAELEARLSERNVERSLSLTASVVDVATRVRGILGELKMVKTALGIASTPPPANPRRTARTSSTRQKAVLPTDPAHEERIDALVDAKISGKKRSL